MTKLRNIRPQLSRMLAILRDGQPHSRAELQAALADELSANGVKQAMCDLRKHLRPDRDILIQYISHRVHYRLVRLISVKKR